MTARKSDYTFKYNLHRGKHGWLRLTPAYSVKLVREIIEGLSPHSHILDPFSGMATIGIVAGEYGYPSTLLDINPFLVWFGNAKLRLLDIDEAEALRKAVHEVVELVSEISEGDLWYPKIKNVERWWNHETLKNLAKLRSALASVIHAPLDSPAYALLWIAFARVVMEHSATAYNHVSVSFQKTAKPYSLHQILFSFISFAESFIEDALICAKSNSRVHLLDSTAHLPPEFSFDAIVTSPPYPNRISYMRELRPYMFWLEFLTEPRQAGELDWRTIGGTWGIATSRLTKWSPTIDCSMNSLTSIVRAIRESKGPNCELLSIYVHKYFHDIDKHIALIKSSLNDKAEIRYVVGNSSFYGIHVPTPVLYEEALRSHGFVAVNSRVLRKRNSKKELFEYCVSGRLDK